MYDKITALKNKTERKLDFLTASERREKIKKLLSGANEPLSASKIAKVCSVSRQIIVGDIALIRAGGLDVQATPRGYILNKALSNGFFEGLIACTHKSDQIEKELYTIIDFGATVVDVTVEHAVYGEISAVLQLSSRFDAGLFIEKLKNCDARPLSALTDGVHLHKIHCASKEIFDKICDALRKEGILFESEQ